MYCAGCEFTHIPFMEERCEDHFYCLQFLKRHGAIRNSLNCPHCGVLCREIPEQLLFRCCKSSHRANFIQSMRTTWLRGTHLRLKMVCRFICYWLFVPHPRQNFLKKELAISHGTVVKWSQFCREVCLHSLLMRGDQFVGGEGVFVEVHKAKLEKHQSKTKLDVKCSWIFCAFERDSRGCFFELAEDCSAETFMDVVLRRISPGTTIISDMCSEYDPLQLFPQFQNFIIKQHLNFVYASNGSLIPNNEQTWKNIHCNIPRLKGKHHDTVGYLAEFCWKNRFEKKSQIHNFFLEIGKQFCLSRN